MLGEKMLEGDQEFADSWNFGPEFGDTLPVESLVELMKEHWPDIQSSKNITEEKFKEARTLRLDSSKAKIRLGWKPVWNSDEAVRETSDWYRKYYEEKKVVSRQQLEKYVEKAELKNLSWVKDEI